VAEEKWSGIASPYLRVENKNTELEIKTMCEEGVIRI